MIIMKKYSLFLIALLGVTCWSCSEDDPEPNPVTATITLSAPADNASYDLSVVDNVSFQWATENVTGSQTLLLSKSQDLSLAVTKEGASPISLSKSDLDAQLEALGVAKGAQADIYWSVKAASSNIAIPAARKLTLKRLPEAPIELAEITNGVLDYKNPATTVNFAWTTGHTGVTFDLTLSKNADLSLPFYTESGITGLNKQLTYAQLQALIENKANGLKRYLDNTVYWNVKVTGEDITSLTNGEFTLAGYKCFTDVRGTESITYDVSIITYTEADGGATKIWLSNDLRAEYGTDGVKLPSIEEDYPDHVVAHVPAHGGSWNDTIKDGRAGAIPENTQEILGLFYKLSDVTYGDKMLPAGWILPTFLDFQCLIRASGSDNGYPLLHTSVANGTNAMNMNFVSTGEGWAVAAFNNYSFTAGIYQYPVSDGGSWGSYGGFRVGGNWRGNGRINTVRLIYDGD
jgi:hypothetical protein